MIFYIILIRLCTYRHSPRGILLFRREIRHLKKTSSPFASSSALWIVAVLLTTKTNKSGNLSYPISTVDDSASYQNACVLQCQSDSGTTADNKIFQVSGKSNYENVQFSEQIDPYLYEVESAMDTTRTLQDTSDTTLENFFSRPVKVAEEEWSTSTSQSFDIDPWSLYFDNPRVANRLTNFNLLKCNLKVKVVINGNGFQYGRMLVNYLPYEDYDPLSSNASLVREDLIQASQQPHIFLDPTTSLGGEMKLPFFLHTNYLSIPYSNWSQMGKMYFRTLNQLKHANGATDVVTISVFAWAEDVSMSVLTSLDQNTLTPQSGETEEANKTGMISGPATSIAKFAAYLTGVPYIAPFALATEIGANAVAAMAKIFGYSRPNITKTAEPYRPTQISSLALTTVPDNAQKLTVDDKQELTIDPRIAGIGAADPLNLREIAKRESYLTTFGWNIGTAPDSILWNSRVDPVTWAEQGTPKAFHFPACAYAALPFQYWKGTMKFRFQIVCSTFHKGRLKIVWDPNFIANNNYLGFSEYNTNYLKIVDIAEETDFTIECGMGQEVSYLEHHNPGRDSVNELYSTSRYTSFDTGNGVLGVFVVNELTTPNSIVDNSIEINVFVSMGDDFEVAVPSNQFAEFIVKPTLTQSGASAPEARVPTELKLEPQSGEIVPEAQNTIEPSAPQQEESCIVGLPPADDSQLNKVFFGESITSFRPMLKRYALWNSIPKISPDPTAISGRFAAFPYFRGSVPAAVDLTASGDSYNYCNTLLLHWVTLGFSGRRGSIRYKMIPRGAQDRGDYISVQRSPLKQNTNEYHYESQDMDDYSSIKEARRAAVQRMRLFGGGTVPWSRNPMPANLGLALTTNQVNGALEFEMPYYSPFRFTPGKRIALTGEMLFEAAWDWRVLFAGNGGSTKTAAIDVYAAAGEDFQTYFFTGMPRMYFEPVPPA
jgi:hypothetical protein